MNKEQLLNELSLKISTGEISREEIQSKFGIPSPAYKVSEVPQSESRHMSINKILYLIGAAIVVIGIVIFVGQIWEEIGSVGRILVTLGLGFVFAVMGSMMLSSKPEDKIGQVFHAIGGVLIPGGSMVLLYELQIDGAWPMAIAFGSVAVFYFLLNIVQKNVVLTLFTIANGTTFIYLMFNAILGDAFYKHDDLYAYLTMVLGVSYLMLGYSFKDTWNSRLKESLYSIGSLGILGSAYTRVFDSVGWQFFFFVLVLGGIYLSVFLKNRSILILSTVFLVAHVSYITSEYFANSLGWPLSLILLGMVFIGLGYMSININKKYISG